MSSLYRVLHIPAFQVAVKCTTNKLQTRTKKSPAILKTFICSTSFPEVLSVFPNYISRQQKYIYRIG